MSTQEVERMVADAYSDALALLGTERRRLDALGAALLERGQLERVDVLVAIGGKPEPRMPSPRRRPLRAVPVAQPIPVLAAAATHREGALVWLARWIERRSGHAERRRGAPG